MRLYVNGMLEEEQFLLHDDLWSSTTCGLGTYTWDLEREHYFNGWIDAIRVSEGARYDANFVPPVAMGTDSETMALWSLEAGAGDFIEDNSSHIHNGINHGATWVLVSEAPAVRSDWSEVKTLY